MSYPTLYRELERMIDDTALETKNSRAVFRKAGFRPGEGTAVSVNTRIRTLIDAWVMPTSSPLLYQWHIDLSGFEKIRFSSMHSGPGQTHVTLLRLYLSLDTGSTALAPAIWETHEILSANIAEVGINAPLRWESIPETLRVPLRVAIGRQGGEFDLSIIPTPFSMTVQVF